ncbi:hypothetical protein TcWFU_006577 [Taenia crassiceps]|uniref:Uncharacterized protein n=1 Tax=Taenia crassiceps TaxID=6207 RepID=A0ABR4QF01_9CEST
MFIQLSQHSLCRRSASFSTPWLFLTVGFLLSIEIDEALRIFAFFPSKGYGYSGSFPPLSLRELARRFNFPNIHLLLAWDVDSERVDFIIESVLSAPLTFQLYRSRNEVDLVVSIAKALLRKQACLEELEKANEESLSHLNFQDSVSSASHKRKTSGMSLTNPQLRKRRPATGLTACLLELGGSIAEAGEDQGPNGCNDLLRSQRNAAKRALLFSRGFLPLRF